MFTVPVEKVVLVGRPTLPVMASEEVLVAIGGKVSMEDMGEWWGVCVPGQGKNRTGGDETSKRPSPPDPTPCWDRKPNVGLLKSAPATQGQRVIWQYLRLKNC